MRLKPEQIEGAKPEAVHLRHHGIRGIGILMM